MNNKILWALVLIAVTVIVLLMNRQGVDIRLIGGVRFDMPASFAYLIFTALGVSIGVLLK